MQKIRTTRRKWWRSEALYLASAAGLVICLVLSSLGIYACVSRETDNKADVMESAPGGMQNIRATRVSGGSLALCDKAHPFSEYAVELIEQDCISLSLFTLGGLEPFYRLAEPTIRLNREAAISLFLLSQALAEAGHTTRLYIQLGYLPYDGIGESPYHTGYEVSLAFLTEPQDGSRIVPLSQAEDDPSTRSATLWLIANRARFGWVLGQETDALRYVGLPHAAYMEMHQLSLSAYLALLATHTVDSALTYTIYGKQYTLYYRPSDHGAAVFLIPNAPFSLSGDGSKGFIVCYVSSAV